MLLLINFNLDVIHLAEHITICPLPLFIFERFGFMDKCSEVGWYSDAPVLGIQEIFAKECHCEMCMLSFHITFHIPLIIVDISNGIIVLQKEHRIINALNFTALS